MTLRLSRWFYWPIRLLAELALLFIALLIITRIERYHPDFFYYDFADILRIHLIYGILVFWLSRWHPMTIWITGTIYALGLLGFFLFASALYLPFPFTTFAFATVIYAAYQLGKSQHRIISS